MHFQVYSLRAEAIVPVYEVVFSPWHIKNKIRPEALLQKERILGFSETQVVIAGFETQKVLADLENERMRAENYKYQLQNVNANAHEIGHNLAAEMSLRLFEGQKPPRELLRWIDRLMSWATANKWFILLLVLLLVVWVPILMSMIIPPPIR